MDLVYMNNQKVDIGVMHGCKFDLAFGSGENDFQITVDSANHVLRESYYVYMEGTEYGGIIDRVQVITAANEIRYRGRTWHGLLDSKVIQPDPGDDYLIISGEANTVLQFLIDRYELSGIFKANTQHSGIYLSGYKMNRYISCYAGICKMLAAFGAKLKISYMSGFVSLSAIPIIDHTHNDEYDSSQISLDITKNYAPLNHLICLGQGDLAARAVIHLYTDKYGNVSYTQTQFGIYEVCAPYDYSSAESLEELERGGREILKEAYASDVIRMSLNPTIRYDVGDIVGAREHITGISISSVITKKIVSVSGGETRVSYTVGNLE